MKIYSDIQDFDTRHDDIEIVFSYIQRLFHANLNPRKWTGNVFDFLFA